MQQPGLQTCGPASPKHHESEGRTAPFGPRLPLPSVAFWTDKKLAPNSSSQASKTTGFDTSKGVGENSRSTSFCCDSQKRRWKHTSFRGRYTVYMQYKLTASQPLIVSNNNLSCDCEIKTTCSQMNGNETAIAVLQNSARIAVLRCLTFET